MDRAIFTALNAISIRQDARITQSQNLANMSVPGFRRDIPNEGATKYLDPAGGLGVRAFQMESAVTRFSDRAGTLSQTGADFDVAIAQDGYFFAMGAEGMPGLTRRGDLRQDAEGALMNGAGQRMLGEDMAPIVLPPHRSMRITDLGEIHIEPADGPAGQTVLAGMLATVAPAPGTPLTKGLDGLIRADDGTVPPPDQGARVLQGVLEASNVNPVEELLASIDVQRGYEIGMRMILQMRTIDEAGASLMQAPQA